MQIINTQQKVNKGSHNCTFKHTKYTHLHTMRELKLETSKKNYTITNSIEEKNIYIQIYIYIPLSIDAQKNM